MSNREIKITITYSDRDKPVLPTDIAFGFRSSFNVTESDNRIVEMNGKGFSSEEEARKVFNTYTKILSSVYMALKSEIRIYRCETELYQQQSGNSPRLPLPATGYLEIPDDINEELMRTVEGGE